MHRYKDCSTCQYCERNGYQDMGFSCDVCAVCSKRDLWLGLLDSKADLNNCPFHSDKLMFREAVSKIKEYNIYEMKLFTGAYQEIVKKRKASIILNKQINYARSLGFTCEIKNHHDLLWNVIIPLANQNKYDECNVIWGFEKNGKVK